MTTIDIILFCYKQEQYIEQALQSIYDQQVPKDCSVRIIVADDCSPDNTLALIEKHAAESPFPIIFLPKEPNMGISKNYKRSFAATTADIVFILEGDDYWLPNHLSQHIAFLKKHRHHSMSCNLLHIYIEGEGFRNCSWPYYLPYISVNIHQQIANGNQLGNLTACAFRSKLLKKIPNSFYDLNFADWELGMLMAQHGPIGILKESTSVYREKPSGQWVQLSSKARLESRLKTIEVMNNFFGGKYKRDFDILRDRIEANGPFSFIEMPIMSRMISFFRTYIKKEYHFFRACKSVCINFLMNLWYKFVIKSHLNDLYQKCYVCYLRHQDKVNVVFVATLLSQWKYQRVYELLKADGRFNTTILVAPMRHYETSEDYVAMKRMLDSNGVDYVDWEKLSEKDKDIRRSLRPDVMFYVQPYYHIYDKRVDSHSFKDKLICHAFYAFPLYNLEFLYNMEMHNRAWKLFYPTNYDKIAAKRFALNRGRNLEITGFLNYDIYRFHKPTDVWRNQLNRKKRIIWSPHFSITADSELNQSNFLDMADFMVRIAEDYRDSIQFAFKPHPKLKRELYLHPEWGKEKTDAYYELWDNMPNTQYNDGDFFDVFMTSDGMINDSGSFTAEYIYTLKPAINTYLDLERTKHNMSIVGLEAMDVQYYGKTEQEIRSFLDSVIIHGGDFKYQNRTLFYYKYLLPPKECYVAESVYRSMVYTIYS